MTAPVLTFFSHKGGVGKTSLIYHLAWMFASLQKSVVIADLDPQANLTAAFLDDERINELWNNQETGSTLYRCVKPLAGVGDITEPTLQKITHNLHLLPGDVALSSFEDNVSEEWTKGLGGKNLYRPMRILTAFWQVLQMAAAKIQADIILVDIGPNLGAINRSVLLGTDYVVIPLGTDLFSLRGLSNLGPTLRDWRKEWQKRQDNWHNNKPDTQQSRKLQLPGGKMKSIGYLCQQYSVRLSRPVKAYDRWVQRIPDVYRRAVLGESNDTSSRLTDDPYCLAIIKHYRSLIPMAQEHRKPIFNLTSADGAIGSHAHAVSDAKNDFRQLAQKIAGKINLAL
ncbi:MAG: ParA family protein [Pseudomonadota bacterium]